ncbi:MAG: beta-galactosidase [Bryobacteraceae bacterium]
MRRLVLVMALAALAAPVATPAGNPPAAQCALAVEFPYYLCPRTHWERELVWLKNLGVRTVEFSVPWNWHEVAAGDYDFSGRTSPRRDLAGLLRLLHRLGLEAWVRPLGTAPDWPGGGAPTNASAAARREWMKQLKDLLEPQMAAHSGPIVFLEGGELGLGGAAPPTPVTTLSAVDANAFARSRAALAAARGAVLWRDVEEGLYPAGWAPAPGTVLRPGAVSLDGDETAAVRGIERDAALLRNWARLLAQLERGAPPRLASGKPPIPLAAAQLCSPTASAVAVTNPGPNVFHDDLRVWDTAGKHALVMPRVTVPAGESLWLPVSVSLAGNGLCRECSSFSPSARIVYATVELLSVEYENGILAMEFTAPVAGEAVLQLDREPVGPYLAAGREIDFDWDEKSQRAPLSIPAGRAPEYRVRVGLAIEEPEASAFFDDAHRLVIGQANPLATSYSSPDLALRSRLRLPDGYRATRELRPGAATDLPEIHYRVSVPADAAHGDFVTLGLEADGLLLGRARLQLFRPVSLRAAQAIDLHFGPNNRLEAEPPVVPVEPRAGSDLDIVVRNNWPAIQTFHLTAAGDGLEFLPASSEISIGAAAERHFSLRVFGAEGAAGLRDWRLGAAGAGTAELPMRTLLIPRGRTVAWSADLDGDGTPEWVVESQKARAIFSSADGGRWMEFTSKDNDQNFLPVAGVFAAGGPVEVRIDGDGLEFTGKGWRRTVHLTGARLRIEQNTPLPADHLTSWKRSNVTLVVEHPSPASAVYTLQ